MGDGIERQRVDLVATLHEFAPEAVVQMEAGDARVGEDDAAHALMAWIDQRGQAA